MLRKGRVQLDGLPGEYECYVREGEDWNGFALPYFAEQTLYGMAQATPGIKILRDFTNTVYLLTENDYPDEECYWTMQAEAEFGAYQTDAGVQWLCPLGAGNLCWSEVKGKGGEPLL